MKESKELDQFGSEKKTLERLLLFQTPSGTVNYSLSNTNGLR